MVWYSHLFKNFPQLKQHSVADMSGSESEVNKAKGDVFLELSCFFDDPPDIGNLISCSSAFSKSNFYIWNLLVRVLLKPSLKDFEYYFASMSNECNCMIV